MEVDPSLFKSPDDTTGLSKGTDGKYYLDTEYVLTVLHKYLFIEWESREEGITVAVNCNDLFLWACADEEAVEYEDLPVLYSMHLNSQIGVDLWVCKKRGMPPQKAVADRWKKNGLWEDWLDELPKASL